MSPALPTLAAAGGTAATFGGVGLLRLAWRRPRPAAATVAGWTLLALATLAWLGFGAADKAVALGLLFPSLAGLVVVAAHAEVRPSRRRPERSATELPDRSGQATWRAVARTLLGGPLAGVAAFVLAAAWALRGPGTDADRLGVALLLAPAFWAAGLIWATTDRGLLRVGGGLCALILTGVAGAML